jgi:hypothetical protein
MDMLYAICNAVVKFCMFGHLASGLNALIVAACLLASSCCAAVGMLSWHLYGCVSAHGTG